MGARNSHSPSEVLVRAIVCLLVDQILFLELRFSGWWAMSPHSEPQSRVWLMALGHRSSLGDDSSLIHSAYQVQGHSAALLSTTISSSRVSYPIAKVGARMNVFRGNTQSPCAGESSVYINPLSSRFSCGTESCFDRYLPSRQL